MKTIIETVDALELRIKQLDSGIAVLRKLPYPVSVRSEAVKEELETLLDWIRE